MTGIRRSERWSNGCGLAAGRPHALLVALVAHLAAATAGSAAVHLVDVQRSGSASTSGSLTQCQEVPPGDADVVGESAFCTLAINANCPVNQAIGASRFRITDGSEEDLFGLGLEFFVNGRGLVDSCAIEGGSTSSASGSATATFSFVADEATQITVLGGFGPTQFEGGTASGSCILAGTQLPPGRNASTVVTIPSGAFTLVCTAAIDVSGRGQAVANLNLGLSLGQAGGEILWRLPENGSFDVAANWDPARTPIATDRARFELVGTYGVQLGGARSLAGAVVRESLLEFLGGPLALTSSPALALGSGARLTLAGGTVTTADLVIGDVSLGRPSMLRVTPGGVLDAPGAVRVGDRAAGVLEVEGGGATLGETAIGGPADTGPGLASLTAVRPQLTAEPVATPDQSGGKLRLVSGGVATLAGLALGGGGPGLVDVRQGSLLRTLGDTRVGVAPGPGFAIIDGGAGDAFSTWQSDGALLIGTDASGMLDMLGEARVRAASLELGVGPGGFGGLTMAGGLSGTPELEVTGLLAVGSEGIGDLTISNGRVQAAEVRVARTADAEGTVRVTNVSELTVAGLIAVGIPGAARMVIDGTVQVQANVLSVGTFNPNVPSLTTSVVEVIDGFVSVADTVLVGNIDETTGVRGAVGTITVQGRAGNDGPSLIARRLLDLRNGEVVVGEVNRFPGSLIASEVSNTGGLLAVRAGGNASFDSVEITGAPGAEPVLEVNAATVAVRDALAVGDEFDPARRGRVQLDGRPPNVGAPLLQVGRELFVGPGGVIAGTGVIRVGALDVEPAGGTLTNLGTISAGSSPGTIVVDGNYTQGATGTLVAEVAGTEPGAFDVLDVRGTAQLGGTLVLRFLGGYLPRVGDAFSVLAGQVIEGQFDAVRVENAGPEFDFRLTPGGGGLRVTTIAAAGEAPCGDTDDGDGDGVICTDVCPAVANADQADVDGDRLGDACDPCSNGTPLTKPVLTVTKKQLALAGTIVLPPETPLDLASTGARVLIEDDRGRALATLDAPPGAFDKKTRSGWKKGAFKSARGPIRLLTVRSAKRTPGTASIALAARETGLDLASLTQPLAVRVLLDTTALPTSRCAEVVFSGPPSVNPTCKASRKRLRCGAQKRR